MSGWRGVSGGSSLLAALALLALIALSDAVALAITPAGTSATCSGRPATIVGSAGADSLKGTAGPDVIAGRGGTDRIFGGGGDDLICGADGADAIHAGSGDDKVFGQSGADRLFGDRGDDLLAGGSGSDRCQGGTGTDAPKGCEAVADRDSGPARAPIPLPEPKTPVIVDHGGILGVAPVAADDEASFSEGEAARSIDVIANDAAADGGPLAIVTVTQPGHGTVVQGEGPWVSYQPNPGYCNDGEPPDSFTYTLNGGSTATVQVAVVCLTRIASDPILTPAFDPAVSDYTVACDGSPLTLSGRTAAGTTVAVDDEPATTGSFEAEVPLAAEQEFGFAIEEGGQLREYQARCLPADFPTWEYERLRQPSHGFYMAAPTLVPGQGRPYAVIFDDRGVPLWWYRGTPGPIDAKFLGTDSVAWWTEDTVSNGYVIRDFDGNVTGTVSIVGGGTDIHELQQEPNGDYLVTSYQPREDVDLTEFGGAPDDSVVDGVIQELDAAGDVVWEWSTENHIGLHETGRWWPSLLAKDEARDVVHMNAVEPVGDTAVLISLRHTDAVYKIDKASGEVVWKLGGTWTPKSLAVSNDPNGAYPLGGQHDVRLQSNGTVTIHDNRTNLPGSPRGVRYEINEAAKTATLVEEVTDPLVPSSFCCGSSRRSDDGSWLFSWGGNSLVTEFNGLGQRTFRLGFGGTDFSYRAVSAPGGVSAAALRAGMDSMHPRP
jgi:Ca2+-binding RTX toxin-like protein